MIAQQRQISIKQIVKNDHELIWEYAAGITWEYMSRLIESALLLLPTGRLTIVDKVIDRRSNLIVVDGIKLLTSAKLFSSNGFRLTGLEVLDQHNGKQFSEFAHHQQRRIMEHAFDATFLRGTSTPDGNMNPMLCNRYGQDAVKRYMRFPIK